MPGNYQDRLDGYVDVAQRITMFRDKYPDGSLQPVAPSEPYRLVEIDGRTFIVYVAAAYRTPDDTRPGIGMAWEPFPGRTPYTKDSELMVAETSAWGRAIKACLLDDRSKVASLDEVRARRSPSEPSQSPQEARTASDSPDGATGPQKGKLRALAKQKGYALPDIDQLTKRDAMQLIDQLLAMPDAGTDQEEPF